jgi:hypothetical protein
MEEWIASDMILTEPIDVPTINFIRTSPVLEMTESRAVLSFSLSSDALSIGGVLINAGKLLATNSHQGIVQTSLLNQKRYESRSALTNERVTIKKSELFLRMFLLWIVLVL